MQPQAHLPCGERRSLSTQRRRSTLGGSRRGQRACAAIGIRGRGAKQIDDRQASCRTRLRAARAGATPAASRRRRRRSRCGVHDGTPSTPHMIRATVLARSASAGAMRSCRSFHESAVMPIRSAMPMRCSLPVGADRNLVENENRLGTLNRRAARRRSRAAPSPSPSAPARSTTAAATSSPSLSCGIANVTALVRPPDAPSGPRRLRAARSSRRRD